MPAPSDHASRDARSMSTAVEVPSALASTVSMVIEVSVLPDPPRPKRWSCPRPRCWKRPYPRGMRRAATRIVAARLACQRFFLRTVSLIVPPGLRRTVDCLIKRPVEAERPRFPEEPEFRFAAITFSLFWAFAVGLDQTPPTALRSRCPCATGSGRGR